MPNINISKLLVFPELKIVNIISRKQIECIKESPFEICIRCARPSGSIYDHRIVRVKDKIFHECVSYLKIRKRRFWCKHCLKPFTEPVPGILPRRRSTQRLKAAVYEDCKSQINLKSVCRKYECSSDFVYRSFYAQLELERRKNNLYPWPEHVGIDEHHFRRNKQYGFAEYVTMIVDHSNKKVYEVVEGKTTANLHVALAEKEGRTNVKYVTMDMCDSFRNYVIQAFPNAEIIADKFHILRLLSASILRRRKDVVGSRTNMRARKLLLMSSKKLDFGSRSIIYRFLNQYPELNELYHCKERLHGFYLIRGYNRAKKAFFYMTDHMALSKLPEIQTLRKSLLRWQNEILNYFKINLTNARVEGFNNKAKLIKKMAYGYKNCNNYRLRILSACH